MNEPRPNVIRVALADKNPLIHAALRQLLSDDPRFELVHVASSCDEFLRKLADGGKPRSLETGLKLGRVQNVCHLVQNISYTIILCKYII